MLGPLELVLLSEARARCAWPRVSCRQGHPHRGLSGEPMEFVARIGRLACGDSWRRRTSPSVTLDSPCRSRPMLLAVIVSQSSGAGLRTGASMTPPCASAGASRSGSRMQRSRPGAPSRAPPLVGSLPCMGLSMSSSTSMLRSLVLGSSGETLSIGRHQSTHASAGVGSGPAAAHHDDQRQARPWARTIAPQPCMRSIHVGSEP